MTSLTKTAIVTRKVIRYSIFAIILLIVGRILFSTGVRVYRHFFPAPPPPPTVSFGKLPSITFGEGRNPDNLSYTVQTPEGGLPTLDTQARVYFMPKQSPNLLGLDVAIEKADDLGYNPNPEEVTETIYRFAHENVPATLRMNIVTGIFSISYDLSQDATPIERVPPAPEVAASQTRSYLSSADLLPEDLTGRLEHDFLRIEEGQLVPALGQSDADITRIDLFRKNFDGYPSVTPNVNEANVWFYVSGSQERAKQFIAGQYHYFPVDESQSATYPIKTAAVAFEELKNGDAFIARAPSEGNIIIRRVYLAYFDAGRPSEFYQPVVVFEGENFTAYVPAVTPDYYGE